MHRVTLRSVLLVAFETAMIIAAVGLAAWLRLGDDAWRILVAENGFGKALLVAAVAQICLYYADLYDLKRVADQRELAIRIVQALGAASFILAAVYFWFPNLIIGRGVFLIAALLIFAVIIGWRLIFGWLAPRVRPRERLLLVGTTAQAVALARELYDRRAELGVEI